MRAGVAVYVAVAVVAVLCGDVQATPTPTTPQAAPVPAKDAPKSAAAADDVVPLDSKKFFFLDGLKNKGGKPGPPGPPGPAFNFTGAVYTYAGVRQSEVCVGTPACQCAVDDTSCFNATSKIGTCLCNSEPSTCPPGAIMTGCECLLIPDRDVLVPTADWAAIAEFGGELTPQECSCAYTNIRPIPPDGPYNTVVSQAICMSTTPPTTVQPPVTTVPPTTTSPPPDPVTLNCSVAMQSPSTFDSTEWSFGAVGTPNTVVSPAVDPVYPGIAASNQITLNAFPEYQDPAATAPQRKTYDYNMANAVPQYGVPMAPNTAYLWTCSVYVPSDWQTGSASANQLNIPNFREVRCQGYAADEPTTSNLFPVMYVANSVPFLANSVTFLATDAKLPVGPAVQLDAWNSMCMVMTVAGDGLSYSTRYFANGAPISPALTSPSGTASTQLYAESAIIGVTTNKVANYTANFGNVGFCSTAVGDPLPAVCGGGTA